MELKAKVHLDPVEASFGTTMSTIDKAGTHRFRWAALSIRVNNLFKGRNHPSLQWQVQL